MQVTLTLVSGRELSTQYHTIMVEYRNRAQRPVIEEITTIKDDYFWEIWAFQETTRYTVHKGVSFKRNFTGRSVCDIERYRNRYL